MINNINNPFYQKSIRNYENSSNETEMVRLKPSQTRQLKTETRINDVRTLINVPGLVENELRPGDILMSYYPNCYGIEDYVIKFGQLLGKKIDKESIDYVHVSIYLGDGKVAEAVRESDKVDLKINTLDHERFKIKEGRTNEFRVFRCKSKEIAEETSRLGNIVASEDKQRGEEVGSYNFKTVLLSPIKPKNLNKDAIARYLKAAYFSHTNETPTDKSGPRDFHCSYLVLWLYQAAESKLVINKLNESLDPSQQIVFPDLSNCTTLKEKGHALDCWAKGVADIYENELRELISIDLNVKAASPQDTYNFLVEKNNLFEPVLRIVAPKSEYELN